MHTFIIKNTHITGQWTLSEGSKLNNGQSCITVELILVNNVCVYLQAEGQPERVLISVMTLLPREAETMLCYQIVENNRLDYTAKI